jgi:FAD:protein FMN transferase
MATISFRAMGCQMLAVLDSEALSARTHLDRVPQWFETWEQSLSRFRPDSELSRLNRLVEQDVPVSDVLWNVFQAAARAEQRSGGVVTPWVLPAVLAAGYTGSFETISSGSASAGSAALETAVVLPARDAVIATPAARSLRLPPGAGLDFGGTAKGWAAQQASRRLQLYGPALFDAGGDIAITGRQADGQPWAVGIANPFDSDSNLEVLALGRCGVATSGRDYRRWLQDGIWKHHIIDPRSGHPAETDVLSATVIAPTLEEAETAAKVVLILGSQEGMAWLERQPGMAALMVLEDGRQLSSLRFDSFRWSRK